MKKLLSAATVCTFVLLALFSLLMFFDTGEAGWLLIFALTGISGGIRTWIFITTAMAMAKPIAKAIVK